MHRLSLRLGYDRNDFFGTTSIALQLEYPDLMIEKVFQVHTVIILF